MDSVAITAGRVGSWVGLAAHLCLLPFYGASGLVAPLWAIIALFAVWLALLGVCLWAVRARSAWGLLVPVLAVGSWLGGVSAGEALLGWTA